MTRRIFCRSSMGLTTPLQINLVNFCDKDDNISSKVAMVIASDAIITAVERVFGFESC